MSRDLIRWLHLSDFHVGKDDYGQRRLFKYILENVKAKVQAGEGPHLVFITGDIAHSGLGDQYKLFGDEFLQPLREAIGHECASRTYIIPGNHDVDRMKNKAVETHGVLDRFERFLDPTEEGWSYRKDIFERFEAFAKWDGAGSTDHWLFSPAGAFWRTPEANGHRIGILGVNTAWFACNDQDRHQLSAGKGIVESGLERLEECDIRIVLGHHPINWFRDEEVEPVRSLFGKHNVLYLHGHLHKTEARPEGGVGGPFQPIQSGAAFDAREDDLWVNRFLWCALDLYDSHLLAEPLKWSRDRQTWVVDSDAFLPKLKVPEKDLWALPLPGTDRVRSSIGKEKGRIWNVPHSRNLNFTGRE